MMKMRRLSDGELLDAWERARGRSRLDGIITLLAAACVDADHDRLADLPVGDRDAALAALRTSVLGAACEAVVRCAACSERLELQLSLDDLFAPAGAAAEATIAMDGYRVTVRVPTTRDLQALDHTSALSLRDQLLERCVLSVLEAGEGVALASLPTAVRATAIAEMAAADPRADVSLAVSCPGCGGRTDAIFDMAAFLWRELDEWADRLFHDVHVLASAYGWSEREILALTPSRRARYLELVGA